MTRADWEEALARALVERSFRARLLADPADTLGDYGLRYVEWPLVQNARAHTLEQFVAHCRRALPELRSPQ